MASLPLCSPPSPLPLANCWTATTTGLGLQRPPPQSNRVNPISHSYSLCPALKNPSSAADYQPSGGMPSWPPPWPGPAPFAAISQLFWEV